MKYSFKIFLLSLLLCSYLTAEENVKSKYLYLDYKTYPKRVFTGQRFDIILKAVILKDETQYDKIVTTFVDQKNIHIISEKPQWIKDKENIYNSKITFKTQDQEFNMPEITVALIKDDNIIDYITVKPPKIIFEKIAVNQELFSNVIASNLQIHTLKIKQYNNNLLLCTVHIEGENANLEDIYLSRYKEQGIKSFEQKEDIQNIYYYMIIPSHSKQIKFTYYNTKQKDFVMISLPISLEEDLVSTQSNLNPYNSNMLFYKRAAAISFLLLTIVLFIITKKERHLIITTILIAIIAYLFIPNKKTILPKETKVYILPTKHSTIFKTLDNKELVEVINKTDQFTKVLFENKNIGWIRNNDIE